MKLTKTQINVLAQEVQKQVKANNEIKLKALDVQIEADWNKLIKTKEYKELEKLNNNPLVNSFKQSEVENLLGIEFYQTGNSSYKVSYSNFLFKDIERLYKPSWLKKNNTVYTPGLEVIENKIILKSIEGIDDIKTFIESIAKEF